MSAELFPAEFFAVLAALARRPAAEGVGVASAPRPGSGRLGFEHRPYAPGDEPRWIDWRASARAGAPLVRRREEDRGGEWLLVLDRSASLCPRHSRRDEDQRRLALALGWLALEAGATLRVAAGGGPPQLFRGRERRAALQSFLAELPEPSGVEDAEILLRAEHTLVLTDPWGSVPQGARGQLAVVTLILPEEDEPPPGGWVVEDVESRESLSVALDRSRFSRAWEHYLERRRQACLEQRIHTVELRCGQPGDSAAAILHAAEEAGLV